MNVRQATIEASKSDGVQRSSSGERPTSALARHRTPRRQHPPGPRVVAAGVGPSRVLERFSQQAAKTPAPGKCGAGANARPVATLGRRDRPARQIYVRAKLVSISLSNRRPCPRAALSWSHRHYTPLRLASWGAPGQGRDMLLGKSLGSTRTCSVRSVRRPLCHRLDDQLDNRSSDSCNEHAPADQCEDL